MTVTPRPHPNDEERRLEALRRYAILDTDPEASFDRLTRMTARIFRVPIVLVSLIGEHRQWCKSCHGVDFQNVDRSASFCAHAIESDEVFIVPDATQDERFRDNPLVLDGPRIRFYAGAPLITSDGSRLGTLCLIDTRARSEFTAEEQDTLQELAASVMGELELRNLLIDKQHSEAASKAVLTTSPDAIITLDARGVITEWNPAAERMSGYTRDEVLGQSSQMLIGEVNARISGQKFWTFFQRQALRRKNRFVISIRHRDGKVFPGEATLFTVEFRQQRIYTLIVRDLTAQEAARNEIIAQRNLMSTVLNTSSAIMYVKDLNRRYLMINTSGSSALGRPAESVLGRRAEDLFPPSVAAIQKQQDTAVLRSEQPLECEDTTILPDGRKRIFRTTKMVYKNHEGRTVGLIGVSMDITDIRAAEVTFRHHNEMLTRRVEHAQLEILGRLARAAEYRDDDTGEHMIRVGTTSANLARELGLAESEIELIRQTAPLHDVGKIGISDTILLKPGRLTREEFETIKTHSTIGASILQGGHSRLIKMAETIARTHHERWDGSGYPAGLAGRAIPIEGRIVAVADVLDALTSERPYKQAWSLAAAIAEIETQAGRQFDPQVVTALRRLHPDSVSADTVAASTVPAATVPAGTLTVKSAGPRRAGPHDRRPAGDQGSGALLAESEATLTPDAPYPSVSATEAPSRPKRTAARV